LEPRQRLATDAHHRSQMAGDDEDASQNSVESVTTEAPYSHSIINEPSKLLIRNEPEAAPPKFTVIFTVKVRSTSIGAGLQAIRSEVTFRDLSTSIDSDDDSRDRRRVSAPLREAPRKGRHQTP
jgi:hypothetical protein